MHSTLHCDPYCHVVHPQQWLFLRILLLSPPTQPGTSSSEDKLMGTTFPTKQITLYIM